VRFCSSRRSRKRRWAARFCTARLVCYKFSHSYSSIEGKSNEKGKFTFLGPGLEETCLVPALLSDETEPRASERVGEELHVSVGERRELKPVVVFGDVDRCSSVSGVSVLISSGRGGISFVWLASWLCCAWSIRSRH
jgi:hypothetical protein